MGSHREESGRILLHVFVLFLSLTCKVHWHKMYMGSVIDVQGQHWQVRGGMQAWKVETYCGWQRKYFCICAIVELLQNK